MINKKKQKKERNAVSGAVGSNNGSGGGCGGALRFGQQQRCSRILSCPVILQQQASWQGMAMDVVNSDDGCVLLRLLPLRLFLL